MAKTKKTLADALTEKQIAIDKLQHELSLLGNLTEIKDELIQHLESRRDEIFERYTSVGYESEQATNRNGELLYTHRDETSWTVKTVGEWEEIKGAIELNKLEPYFRTKYEWVKVTFDELDEQEKLKLEAYDRVIEYLEDFEY